MLDLTESIYIVYCLDNQIQNNGVTILKKAFKIEQNAYDYALQKISKLLDIISNEYKQSDNKILPVGAQVIYTLFQMKQGNGNEQYEYFKDNYKMFFKYILRDPIMFYVSKLQLN